MTAMDSCTRTHIHNIIRKKNCFFIMFDYDHRIALIAQIFQRGKQAVIIALMQAN